MPAYFITEAGLGLLLVRSRSAYAVMNGKVVKCSPASDWFLSTREDLTRAVMSFSPALAPDGFQVRRQDSAREESEDTKKPYGFLVFLP